MEGVLERALTPPLLAALLPGTLGAAAPASTHTGGGHEREHGDGCADGARAEPGYHANLSRNHDTTTISLF